MVVANPLSLLVPTKLRAPQPLASWVPRTRLLARLGPAPAARLTLVVAPAGFGKSTLVAQWLAQGELRAQPVERAVGEARARPIPAAVAARSAWLTLDEHDQDSLRFLAYLAGAVERAAPGAPAGSLSLLAAAEPPPPYLVIQSLLVELSALPTGLTIVLDDYQAIAAEPIHKIVAYLLRHLPPHCRMVLLSRADPPLPLARLRAEGQIYEVRAEELRFSELEAAALLAQLLGAPPRAGLAQALHQHTEGWAIALQMAALAPAEALGEGRAPAIRQIADYLADEVLARQPVATQATLMALALPERFCAGLCAALLGAPEELIAAEGQIEQLLRANLFAIPLDDEGRWFRFHHLFRELLLRRLQIGARREGVRELHRRAAGWFAAEGLVEEALRHLLAAGDERAAADLVEAQMLPELTGAPRAAAPTYWQRLLPPELRARHLGLALLEAHQCLLSLEIGGLAASLDRADGLLAAAAPQAPPPWPAFQADRAALEGMLLLWQGRPAEAIPPLQAAAGQGPSPALAAQARLFLRFAEGCARPYAEGVRLLEAAGPASEEQRAIQRICLAWMHQLAGQLAEQEREARRLAELVAAAPLGELWLGYSAVTLGLAAYERSELPAAAAQFELLAQRGYRVGYPGYMSALIGLALCAAASGQPERALARAEEARAFAEEVGGSFLRHQALGCAVRVALARGDLAAARDAAAGIGPDISLGLSLWLETPRLSRARACIAAGDPASLVEADGLLAACLGELEPLHQARLLVAALATLALLRQAQGRQAEARASLERAVALAAPRGFVRSLLDLGPGLLPLLRLVAAGGVAEEYIGRLLGAAGEPEGAGRGAPSLPAPALPELLTRREVEILSLLARRWSDKEIAERLVIAPNTVRKHTSTIYQKLGVAGRREAVDTARALGLLPAA